MTSSPTSNFDPVQEYKHIAMIAGNNILMTRLVMLPKMEHIEN